MKINPTGGAGFFPQNLRINKNRADTQAQSVKAGDELALSKDALNFSMVLSEARKAASAAADAPEQHERIAQLREQIANGEYHVDSGAVADSILKRVLAEV